MKMSDLKIETERLVIATVANESNGDKTNYAFLKKDTLTKDNIDIDSFLNNCESNDVVGYINIDRNNFIQYEVYKPFRGMGFATEMLTAVKEFCLSERVSPNLYIDTLNKKSKKAATKSGFEYEEPYEAIPNNEKWGIRK